MSEQIKELIEKIQQEGVKSAQDKAQAIEDQARRQAEDIVKAAKLEAERIIAEAQDKTARKENAGKALLEQAGRDMLLSLRKEINAALEKLIVSQIRHTLKPEELVKIITGLIKDSLGGEKTGVVISLNKQDMEGVEKGFLNELAEETRKGIILKASEDILGGFIISYDHGKSHYDFTDKALAEYISLYLKPKLSEILTAAV
ncbi:MAG: V-type ATP synthase subunit E family protein [Candidatus Omnitrophota bacterium]